MHDVIYTPTTGLDCANGQFWAIDAYSAELLWAFDPVVNGNGQGGTIWTTPAMSRALTRADRRSVEAAVVGRRTR